MHMRMHSDTISEYQPISERDWRRKGLWDKLSDVYKERHHDSISSTYANVLSVAYFWFVLISGQYLMLTCIIPVQYIEWDPTNRYYLRVASMFVFVQVAANCLCIRFFDAFIKNTKNISHAEAAERKQENGTYDAISHNGNHVDINEIMDKHGFPERYCTVCDHNIPYRAHHCIICKKCVLKRDHHCYFTGTCVGHFNQRYFIVMMFYTTIGCTWGMYEFCRFINASFQAADNWDYFLPVTCFRWLLGYVSFRDLLMMWQLYSLWWIGFMAGVFLIWHFFLILTGKTSQEVRKYTKVRSAATVSQKFQSVFGHFWPVSFYFPSVLLFRQPTDGTCWPELRKC